jgi:signal transduction histidine kinase
LEAAVPQLPDLDAHLERQMRSQERQLAYARLAIVLAAIAVVLAFRDQLDSFLWLVGLGVAVVVYTGGILLLVGRFPAREVGIVATALDMVVVTLAIYAEPRALDAFLFYLPVILGVALRFGLGASVWASVVMSFMYASVVLIASGEAGQVRDLLAIRIGYLIGLGLAAGLFARVVIGRATDNARLQHRLDVEEAERAHAREAELLSQMAREFGNSLERDETVRTIVGAAAPLLGDVTWLQLVTRDGDGPRGQLSLARIDGRDAELVARLRDHLGQRDLRVGEGIAGSAAATASAVVAGDAKTPPPHHTGDPDGVTLAGLRSVLSVPIVTRGMVRGVLSSASVSGPLLGDGERRLAQAIAERAGPALENAALWADLQEQVVREQEAQRIKDDFLSIVSHELRTPLTSIQGYAQLLEARMRDGASAKQLSQMRVIRSQVGRMRRLVDDLLDVSRIDRAGAVSIEPEPIDLADELRDAAARTEREHPERHVTMDVPDTLPILADHDRIGQVLTNLLDNAVKYSPDGGEVTVRAEGRGDRVVVTVADLGVGIAPELAEQVFERFFQVEGDAPRRQFGGLGLGLYITRAIVVAHGGEITAEPNREAGRGTLFRISLPRRAAATPAPAIDAPPSFVTRRG